MLGPLQDNGGPTFTHALLAGSPAIDAIPEDAGGGGYNGAPATDQRGVSRPQPVGGACDMGAFELEQPTLTVNKAGTGSGTVTSNPPGINCGTDCTEIYYKDTLVTLTATPDANAVFAGWGGDCTGTELTTTVTIDADKTCTATFSLKQFTLFMNNAGSGTGRVTGDPAGINCGRDCTEIYDVSTVVTLTATPHAGSTFAGWSGDCSGTEFTTTVTMDEDKTCTAMFNLKPTPRPPRPVGGVILPLSKVELLAPWIGLAALMAVIVAAVAFKTR